ncbi:GtrA family protein [Pseudomonas huanghezhanensis]|uniref:GtrA family protein n=1 Tax=Pseudomonas huanghezhanensis TaxID=3002903 RepID=UPI0022866A5E|nr:GtrA family protein [Pseudomonas sp. BSw22131]
MNKLYSCIARLDFSRFLLSGGFNTALTYIVYILLLNVATYKVSYTISYALGIVLAYFLNRFFVFRTHRGIKSILFTPLIYLIQYCCSLIIIWLLVEKMLVSQLFAPLAAIAFTLPITFILSKLAFGKMQKQ